MIKKTLIGLAGLGLLLSSTMACETWNRETYHHETETGAVVGGVGGAAAGAVIGEATTGNALGGALIGGLGGAALGTGAGYVVEENRKDRDDRNHHDHH